MAIRSNYLITGFYTRGCLIMGDMFSFYPTFNGLMLEKKLIRLSRDILPQLISTFTTLICLNLREEVNFSPGVGPM